MMIRLPIIMRTEFANRSEKRSWSFEFTRNVQRFDEIELSFLNDLFFNEDKSYKELYKKHKDLWDDYLKWLYRNNKVVYTSIDENYFVDLYKPVESEDLVVALKINKLLNR